MHRWTSLWTNPWTNLWSINRPQGEFQPQAKQVLLAWVSQNRLRRMTPWTGQLILTTLENKNLWEELKLWSSKPHKKDPLCSPDHSSPNNSCQLLLKRKCSRTMMKTWCFCRVKLSHKLSPKKSWTPSWDRMLTWSWSTFSSWNTVNCQREWIRWWLSMILSAITRDSTRR